MNRKIYKISKAILIASLIVIIPLSNEQPYGMIYTILLIIWAISAAVELIMMELKDKKDKAKYKKYGDDNDA